MFIIEQVNCSCSVMFHIHYTHTWHVSLVVSLAKSCVFGSAAAKYKLSKRDFADDE